MDLSLHAQPKLPPVTSNPDLDFILHTQLPQALEGSSLCEVCVFKLIPKQARIAVNCDGERLQIDQKIVSYPREDADTFSPKVRTAVFKEMISQGFAIESTHHEGDCVWFQKGEKKQQPIKATESPQTEKKHLKAFNLEAQKEFDRMDVESKITFKIDGSDELDLLEDIFAHSIDSLKVGEGYSATVLVEERSKDQKLFCQRTKIVTWSLKDADSYSSFPSYIYQCEER